MGGHHSAPQTVQFLVIPAEQQKLGSRPHLPPSRAFLGPDAVSSASSFLLFGLSRPAGLAGSWDRGCSDSAGKGSGNVAGRPTEPAVAGAPEGGAAAIHGEGLPAGAPQLRGQRAAGMGLGVVAQMQGATVPRQGAFGPPLPADGLRPDMVFSQAGPTGSRQPGHRTPDTAPRSPPPLTHSFSHLRCTYHEIHDLRLPVRKVT